MFLAVELTPTQPPGVSALNPDASSADVTVTVTVTRGVTGTVDESPFQSRPHVGSLPRSAEADLVVSPPRHPVTL